MGVSIAEIEPALVHQHNNGETLKVESVEAAIKMCPFLAKLSLEEAGLILELETLGKGMQNEAVAELKSDTPETKLPKKAVKVVKVVKKALPPSETSQDIQKVVVWTDTSTDNLQVPQREVQKPKEITKVVSKLFKVNKLEDTKVISPLPFNQFEKPVLTTARIDTPPLAKEMFSNVQIQDLLEQDQSPIKPEFIMEQVPVEFQNPFPDSNINVVTLEPSQTPQTEQTSVSVEEPEISFVWPNNTQIEKLTLQTNESAIIVPKNTEVSKNLDSQQSDVDNFFKPQDVILAQDQAEIAKPELKKVIDTGKQPNSPESSTEQVPVKINAPVLTENISIVELPQLQIIQTEQVSIPIAKQEISLKWQDVSELPNETLLEEEPSDLIPIIADETISFETDSQPEDFYVPEDMIVAPDQFEIIEPEFILGVDGIEHLSPDLVREEGDELIFEDEIIDIKFNSAPANNELAVAPDTTAQVEIETIGTAPSTIVEQLVTDEADTGRTYAEFESKQNEDEIFQEEVIENLSQALRKLEPEVASKTHNLLVIAVEQLQQIKHLGEIQQVIKLDNGQVTEMFAEIFECTGLEYSHQEISQFIHYILRSDTQEFSREILDDKLLNYALSDYGTHEGLLYLLASSKQFVKLKVSLHSVIGRMVLISPIFY